MLPVIPEARAGYRFIEIARNQPEYLTLPALVNAKETRTEWKLSWRERFEIFFGGHLYMKFLTFGRPMYPVNLWVLRDDDPDQPLPNPLASKVEPISDEKQTNLSPPDVGGSATR